MVLFPVLLPAAISGSHAISTAGRSRPIARIRTRARRPRLAMALRQDAPAL
jgi:hypothetical protein